MAIKQSKTSILKEFDEKYGEEDDGKFFLPFVISTETKELRDWFSQALDRYEQAVRKEERDLGAEMQDEAYHKGYGDGLRQNAREVADEIRKLPTRDILTDYKNNYMGRVVLLSDLDKVINTLEGHGKTL